MTLVGSQMIKHKLMADTLYNLNYLEKKTAIRFTLLCICMDKMSLPIVNI